MVFICFITYCLFHGWFYLYVFLGLYGTDVYQNYNPFSSDIDWMTTTMGSIIFVCSMLTLMFTRNRTDGIIGACIPIMTFICIPPIRKDVLGRVALDFLLISFAYVAYCYFVFNMSAHLVKVLRIYLTLFMIESVILCFAMQMAKQNFPFHIELIYTDNWCDWRRMIRDVWCWFFIADLLLVFAVSITVSLWGKEYFNMKYVAKCMSVFFQFFPFVMVWLTLQYVAFPIRVYEFYHRDMSACLLNATEGFDYYSTTINATVRIEHWVNSWSKSIETRNIQYCMNPIGQLLFGGLLSINGILLVYIIVQVGQYLKTHELRVPEVGVEIITDAEIDKKV